MPKIRMITSYRHFYQPGQIVIEGESKARELVSRGSAEYVEESVENSAPMNKEIQTAKVVGKQCPVCNRIFASERGLKLHSSKSHKEA